MRKIPKIEMQLRKKLQHTIFLGKNLDRQVYLSPKSIWGLLAVYVIQMSVFMLCIFTLQLTYSLMKSKI